MSGVKELKLWQEAVALAGDVTRATKGWAREHQGLADATAERSVALACHIAAGYSATSTEAQLVEYRAAARALADLDTRIAVARHATLLSATTAAQLATRSLSVGRLLAGYVGYVERQVGGSVQSASGGPAVRAASAAVPSA